MYFVACVIKQNMKCILILYQVGSKWINCILVTFRVLKCKVNNLSDEDLYTSIYFYPSSMFLLKICLFFHFGGGGVVLVHLGIMEASSFNYSSRCKVSFWPISIGIWWLLVLISTKIFPFKYKNLLVLGI